MKAKVIPTVLLFLLISSCSQKQKLKAPESGHITYSITYTNETHELPRRRFMPNEMDLIYSKNKIIFSISGALNIFTLNFISNQPDSTYTTYFRLIDNHYNYKSHPEQTIFLFEDQEIIDINLDTKEKKDILGYKCKMAKCTLKDNSTTTAYYTTNFNIVEPNRYTPFRDIPGLVLEFSTVFNGMHLHLKATKLVGKKVDLDKFTEPPRASLSSEKEIVAMVKEMLEGS